MLPRPALYGFFAHGFSGLYAQTPEISVTQNQAL
jgi:hypothetical protein